MTTHQIFIIDDEALICNALQIIIEAQPDMNVVGVAHNGVDALKQLDTIRPDLVLVDIRMPKMDGIECTKKIKQRYPDMTILILTTYNEENYIIDGLANGASGYLLKTLDFAQLVTTIRSTLTGNYVLPAEVAAKLAHYLMTTRSSSHDLRTLPASLTDQHALTPREQDVLLLLGNRLSVREIAKELNITEGTVKNYLTTLYEKLNVSSRYEAIEIIRGKKHESY